MPSRRRKRGEAADGGSAQLQHLHVQDALPQDAHWPALRAHHGPCGTPLQGYFAHEKPRPLGPYTRTMPRALWWRYGVGQFLMSEVPLQPLTLEENMHYLKTLTGLRFVLITDPAVHP